MIVASNTSSFTAKLHGSCCLGIVWGELNALTASPFRKEGKRSSTAKGDTISMMASKVAGKQLGVQPWQCIGLACGDNGILHVLELVVRILRCVQ